VIDGAFYIIIIIIIIIIIAMVWINLRSIKYCSKMTILHEFWLQNIQGTEKWQT
jgi:hypothetical protein